MRTQNEGSKKAVLSRGRMATTIAMWCVTLALMVPAAFGQAADAQKAEQQHAPVVEDAVHHDVSIPLALMVPAPRSAAQRMPAVKPVPRSTTASPRLQTAPDAALVPATEVPISALISTTQANFDGIGNGFSGPAGTFTVNAPYPDANGDVGPNHYVQAVNSDLAVFDKSTGAAIFGPVPINTLWSAFGGCQTQNDGDPIVLYDPIADRWVISQFAVSGADGATAPFLECVAVSQTPDPTGSYFRYSFPYAGFPDYPKLGVWPDAYYATFNMFSSTTNAFLGGKVCAYDRTSMLAGLAATQQCFDVGSSFGGLLPADLDGSRLPPAGAPNPVLALGANPNELAFWAFHVDWATPGNSTLTGPTALAVAAFTEACNAGTCIPQLGTTQQLDSLGDRLMNRLAYRNFADGHQSLVVNHSVTAGSGVGVRWYEIRLDPAGKPSIFQQGTYAPDSNFRWMGSVAMDQSGDIAMGFSLSDSTLNPAIHYTGRLHGDALGTMTQGEGSIIDGTGSQIGLSRWGQYTSMTVDPSDDCTFWYTNEYIPADGAFNWSTRIGSFKFPSCGPAAPTDDFSIVANPTSISTVQGGSASTTITTTVTAGNAQSVALSVVGLSAGATAAFSPASITAGGSSTLTISTTSSTPAGTYALSAVGTGTSATHGAPMTLVVTPSPASDFSISATPSVISVSQGSLASSPISTTALTGPAETIVLSVSGTPAGSTISFTPGSVTTGGIATISVNPGTAALGSYAITVKGTSPSTTHSVVVTLKIVARFRDFSISIAPATANLPAGGSVSYPISSSATSAAVQLVALTVTGLPPGVTGSFSPSSIQAGSPSVLTLTATAAAAPTTAAFIVTGTNNFGTHSVTAQVTVTIPRPPNFTIAITPTAAGVFAGGAAPYTVSTTALGGSTQTVTLVVSGLSTGVTGAFNSTTITAGGSAVLTVSTSTGVAPGTITFTVTGTSSTTSHAATAQLTVTASNGGTALINGDFETGDLTGWTSTGVAAVVSPGHGGNFAARLGSASPTNGDSTISQTFAVPAGAGLLSFWYKMTCPDTVAYDWASAVLRDNTAGVNRTLLAKTCVTGAWTQVFVNVAGLVGHSVTLTLTSHDDGFASDPSFTLFDDVVLSPAGAPGSALVNGDFESGSFTGWTIVTGTASVVPQAHSGGFAALLGSTEPTNGDSSISQTFVALGATSLSFWYKMTCPDTVTYDWATARLKNNTTGALSTMLPKTCSGVATWKQVTAAIVPGQSYTLTLTSHDDNFAGDATYTLFDDVVLN